MLGAASSLYWQGCEQPKSLPSLLPLGAVYLASHRAGSDSLIEHSPLIVCLLMVIASPHGVTMLCGDFSVFHFPLLWPLPGPYSGLCLAHSRCTKEHLWNMCCSNLFADSMSLLLGKSHNLEMLRIEPRATSPSFSQNTGSRGDGKARS